MRTLLRAVLELGWVPSAILLGLAVTELVALLTVPSVLLRRRGQPLAALSWVLALVGLPLLGVLAWWLIGRDHLRRKRRRHRAAHLRLLRRMKVPRHLETWLEMLPPLGRGRVFGAFPAVAGNRVRLLVDGAATYEAVAAALAGARHHVHFLFYTFKPDRVGRRFLELLAERARAGVEVRLLVDALGSAGLAPRHTAALRAAGGRVAVFGRTRLLRRSLTLNFRNHRKIVVVDGRVAVTGGVNVGEEYLTGWRDLAVRLEGPVVGQLQQVFADDWLYATGEELSAPCYLEGCGEPAAAESAGLPAVAAVVAGGPDSRHNLTHDAFFAAVTRARRRVWLTTPYLIPGQAMQAALRNAVWRGVDVRLLVPRRPDVALTRLAGRSFYEDLLMAGVRVFEYLPATLHGKAWVLDDDLVGVGSANLDTRSFKLNFEVVCFLVSPGLCQEVAGLFLRLCGDAAEVTMRELRQASPWQRLAEAAANLASPLL